MKEKTTALPQSSILEQPEDILAFSAAITGDYRIVDVRSPGEYRDGSLPGAINLPIFDNDERSLVGTIYRHGGRDAAIDTGFDLVQARLDQLLAGFAPYRGERLAVFCARGGMRSRSVVNLLRQNGFEAWQLTGGYKQYRQQLLTTLAGFMPPLIVLHGLTGTGKTRLLQRLPEVIDLEDLAQHQSSLFGGINRQPRSQKWFDSHLHQVICRLGLPPYFIEGESRQLGSIYLPAGLAQAMKDGRLVLVTASLATRVARIVEDYPLQDDQAVRQVETILQSLKRRLGGPLVATLCRLLHQDRLAELVEILLLEYYDKRYLNLLDSYRYDLRVSSEDLDEAAALLADARCRWSEREGRG